MIIKNYKREILFNSSFFLFDEVEKDVIVERDLMKSLTPFPILPKNVSLQRNLTAVKFTAIKEWKYEEVLRQGVRDGKAARNAAASV